MKARVRQLHTTRWHKSPVSGHEWPEHTPIQKFELADIGGGYGAGDNLSVQAAEYLIYALDARAAELEKTND